MFSLIIKDMLVAKKYMRLLCIMIVFYIFLGFANNDFDMIGGLITMFLSVLVISTFAYDDQAHWDIYALTMPVRRKDLILSKYVIAFSLAIIASILNLLLNLAFCFYKNISITKEMFLIIAAFLLVSLLFSSIMIPIIVKLGVEKARMAMFAVFLIPMGIGYLLSKSNIPMPSDYTLERCAYALPFIVLAIFLISYFISVRIYEKKDL